MEIKLSWFVSSSNPKKYNSPVKILSLYHKLSRQLIINNPLSTEQKQPHQARLINAPGSNPITRKATISKLKKKRGSKKSRSAGYIGGLQHTEGPGRKSLSLGMVYIYTLASLGLARPLAESSRNDAREAFHRHLC